MSEEIVVQKRRVEITEENGIRDGANHYEFGDRISLPADKAAQFISLGWAKCVETGEQGERRPGVQALAVHSTVDAPTVG